MRLGLSAFDEPSFHTAMSDAASPASPALSERSTNPANRNGEQQQARSHSPDVISDSSSEHVARSRHIQFGTIPLEAVQHISSDAYLHVSRNAPASFPLHSRDLGVLGAPDRTHASHTAFSTPSYALHDFAPHSTVFSRGPVPRDTPFMPRQRSGATFVTFAEAQALSSAPARSQVFRDSAQTIAMRSPEDASQSQSFAFDRATASGPTHTSSRPFAWSPRISPECLSSLYSKWLDHNHYHNGGAPPSGFAKYAPSININPLMSEPSFPQPVPHSPPMTSFGNENRSTHQKAPSHLLTRDSVLRPVNPPVNQQPSARVHKYSTQTHRGRLSHRKLSAADAVVDQPHEEPAVPAVTAAKEKSLPAARASAKALTKAEEDRNAAKAAKAAATRARNDLEAEQKKTARLTDQVLQFEAVKTDLAMTRAKNKRLKEELQEAKHKAAFAEGQHHASWHSLYSLARLSDSLSESDSLPPPSPSTQPPFDPLA